ncbi:hypothetical protein [Methanoculleus sp.]|uniref:hypothetical protein n=1 Tax=Methanoculleus sp. TaxID=90427 RepID=UPI0025E0BD24|nr:hypothetical protein [Methanoculleus sp.]MCK9319728.1 hypothetical protein [Methanoculleus sp.]
MNKLAGINFTDKEMEEIKENFSKGDKFIVRYKTVYQIFYSQNAGLYAHSIYTLYNDNAIGYTKKGRFVITNANFVNRLIGFELLHNE